MEKNHELLTDEQYIEFTKRFADGEQYLEISANGKIVDMGKDYYWQERAVYNHIKPLLDLYINTTNEKSAFGKGGKVDRLIPIQRAYNNVKNRKMEYINRLVNGVLCVEDGSVDMDCLEEGIPSGKIIVYRYGSQKPCFMQENNMIDIFTSTEDRLLKEFYSVLGIEK